MQLDKKKSTYNIVNEMAVKFANINTGVAPFMPSAKQISNHKYKKSLKQCLNQNPIIALQLMKYSIEYKECIKSIGLDPFFIQYWLPYQQHWYNQCSKDEVPLLAMDATGGVAHTPSHPNLSNSKQVFLYNVLAKPKNGVSRPIGHFLSQDNTSGMISHLLSGMFSQSFKKPQQIVVDDSAALLAACVTTFTTSNTTKNYIKYCFDVLNGELEKLPECFIRLDVSHFAKHVVNASCLKNAETRARKFYKCCIGLLINCYCPESFVLVVRLISTVCQSPFIDVGTVNEDLKELKERIEKNGNNQEFDIAENEKDVFQSSSDDADEINAFDFETVMFLEKIFDDVNISKTEGNYESIYFNLEFFKYFKKLLNRAPLWSGLMNKYFQQHDRNPPTSAFCESFFRTTKHIIFPNESLPMRVDKFVEGHLNSIKGLLKLTLDENVQKKNIGM